MKKRVNKGLLGAATVVLVVALGTGGYCKANDITFTQLFSGKHGQEVLSTEIEDEAEDKEVTKKVENAVPQEGAKNLTVYFGDKECPMDGKLKENLDIYEENEIIAKIGENYYLGRQKIDRLDVEGVYESQYNEEKGCYENVMVEKPIYGNLPIVKIIAGPADDKAKKAIVVYEFSANQASAMSCFPTWKMEREEDSTGSMSFVDYPKESYVIKQEETDDSIGCGTIISDGTIVDMSKYEKMKEEYSGDFCWDKYYMGLSSVQTLSAAASDQMTKYIDGEIQSLSMIKIWGKEVGNITVSTYGTEKEWKQYQKMLQE